METSDFAPKEEWLFEMDPNVMQAVLFERSPDQDA